MGKLRKYYLRALNKLSVYPLGNTPSAPSACFHCGKVGYWVRDCQNKKKKQASNSASSSTQKGAFGLNTLHVVATTNANKEIIFLCYFGIPENWLIDSRASDHMSPFRSDFRDYVAYAESHWQHCNPWRWLHLTTCPGQGHNHLMGWTCPPSPY